MYNMELDMAYGYEEDEQLTNAEPANEADILRVEELVARLNTARVRVAMLLAGVRPDRLERAVRLAAPETDANGEYTEESIADEVALVLKEFPELNRQAMGSIPRVGALDKNEQGFDQIAEIFGNK